MTISHVATMAFERVSRLASIPALILAAAAWLVTALPAAAVGLLRDPEMAVDRMRGLLKLYGA